MLMRGGTSRGAFFLARDMPGEVAVRDRVLAAAMGGPDSLQVDGMGGGHPLTSKAAIVSGSERPGADVDYLFLQVNPATGGVDTTQNCGNMLAAVGPFALERGVVPCGDPETRIVVNMVNSGNLCELTVQTPGGAVRYDGDTRIDGVPGTAAAVVCKYLDIAGSATGAMLPTGRLTDRIDGIEATLIDNGMPVVIVRASDLGLSGEESPPELEENAALVAAKESIRMQAGEMMGLGDVSQKTVPKISLVSAPRTGGAISTRTFIPHACHKAIGVLGAASVATACMLPGTVAHGIAQLPPFEPGDTVELGVEHPSGQIGLRIGTAGGDALASVESVGVLRTARLLFRGELLVPASVWAGVSAPRGTAPPAVSAHA